MRICALGLLAIITLNTSSVADPLPLQKTSIMVAHLEVVLAEKTYGLVVATTTETDCPFLRYRIFVAGKSVLTQHLRPGEAIVVKLGQGIAPGRYAVDAKAVGCNAGLSALRIVVLRKASPDHGARALAALARKDQRQPSHGKVRAAPA